MSDKKTVWETLNNIDVSKYIKKKGQLDYLPWSVAVGLVKPYYPGMRVEVFENELGFNYHTDGHTCWVKVGVVIEELTEIEYLPIMDFKNKSIPKDGVTSVDVNKAIKRATVKALSSHGLGISLYAGEELPSVTEDDKHDELTKRLGEVIQKTKDPAKTEEWILKTFKADSLVKLSSEYMTSAINTIEAKKNASA